MPLTPLRPSSTLCSIPWRWRQLSGYLKRKILISPLKRASPNRFQRRLGSRTEVNGTATPMAIFSLVASFPPRFDYLTHVRSVGILERERERVALWRQSPLRIQDFPLSEIYRRQGRRMDEWRVQSGEEQTGLQLDADGYVFEKATETFVSGWASSIFVFVLPTLFPSTAIRRS